MISNILSAVELVIILIFYFRFLNKSFRKFNSKVKLIILIQIIALSLNLAEFLATSLLRTFIDDEDLQRYTFGKQLFNYTIDLLCEDSIYIACILFGFRLLFT